MKLIKLVFLLGAFSAFGQLPKSDVFLVDVEVKNNLLKAEKAIKINKNIGYNSQPFFQDANSLLYSTEVNTKGNVHLAKYIIKSRKTLKFTNGKTSEFSPALTDDKSAVAAVVVEEDSTQRVWLFDAVTGAKKSCVHQGTDSVGYYALIGKDTMIYYKLSDPHSLRVVNVKTGEDNWLCDNPTRSFKKINPTTFFYIIREERQNQIYFFDIPTKKATLFAKDERPENFDYVWVSDLGMVKSERSKLFRYSPETKVWIELTDLSSFGVQKITRFAFSPDKKRVAVVSSEKD